MLRPLVFPTAHKRYLEIPHIGGPSASSGDSTAYSASDFGYDEPLNEKMHPATNHMDIHMWPCFDHHLSLGVRRHHRNGNLVIPLWGKRHAIFVFRWSHDIIGNCSIIVNVIKMGSKDNTRIGAVKMRSDVGIKKFTVIWEQSMV